MTVDPTALDRLRKVGGAAFVNELIDMFAADAWQLVDRARTAAEAMQLEDAFRAAHQLKSTSMTLGAILVYELAERTEHAALTGAHEETTRLLAELSAAVDEAVVVLCHAKVRTSN